MEHGQHFAACGVHRCKIYFSGPAILWPDGIEGKCGKRNAIKIFFKYAKLLDTNNLLFSNYRDNQATLKFSLQYTSLIQTN